MYGQTTCSLGLLTYTFVTSAGRLYGRPVFFDLPEHWRDPFVTTAAGVTEDLADQSAADGVVLSDLAEAQSSLTVTQDGFTIDLPAAAAHVPTFELRSAHTGLNSFDDEVALEFGDCRNDDDDGTTQGPPVSRFSLN